MPLQFDPGRRPNQRMMELVRFYRTGWASAAELKGQGDTVRKKTVPLVGRGHGQVKVPDVESVFVAIGCQIAVGERLVAQRSRATQPGGP